MAKKVEGLKLSNFYDQFLMSMKHVGMLTCSAAIRVYQNYNKVKYSYFSLIIKIHLEKTNHLTSQMSHDLLMIGQFSYH